MKYLKIFLSFALSLCLLVSFAPLAHADEISDIDASADCADTPEYALSEEYPDEELDALAEPNVGDTKLSSSNSVSSSDSGAQAGEVLSTTPPTSQKETTSATSLDKKITKKARSTLKKTVTVSPAYGRTLQLQMCQKDKWITKKTITLPNTKSASIMLEFPNDWWKLSSSQWRIVIPESAEGTAYTSATTTIKPKRYYQNPKKYVQIKDEIALKHSGAY
ncbi:MAG: hypothetical protein LBB42_04890, partial [Coriobacteriales bacterium]|nr:hypothetical protein [Coriobacteriales bacterium]